MKDYSWQIYLQDLISSVTLVDSNCRTFQFVFVVINLRRSLPYTLSNRPDWNNKSHKEEHTWEIYNIGLLCLHYNHLIGLFWRKSTSGWKYAAFFRHYHHIQDCFLIHQLIFSAFTDLMLKKQPVEGQPAAAKACVIALASANYPGGNGEQGGGGY